MFLKKRSHTGGVIKLPNHVFLYGIVIGALGSLVGLGSLIRLYELREFFPIRLPEQVNEFILTYIPFILGTFITTTAACAGVIVGANWLFGGLRTISRFRMPLRAVGDYYRPDAVSVGLKDGRLKSYDHAPSVLFYFIGKLWSNAKYISEIPGHVIKLNIRFLWKAAAAGVTIYFLFQSLRLVPPYLAAIGLGAGYVIPSPIPLYYLLGIVCALKVVIALSLIPLRKPGVSREMDSMIVEGRGHPTIFFAMIEEGSKIFSHKGFSNRISRRPPLVCDDGEMLIGTLIESFPEYVKTSGKPAAVLNLLLGAVLILVGFLQIILMQYPSFSVGYEDFFRLYSFSMIMDLCMNIAMILFGKGFLDQARSLLAVYRFRSGLVYVEAKGDFDGKNLPDLGGIISADKLFNPLLKCAFNVRYFSAEALSECVTPEGPRELICLETSGRLAKDVSRLKFLPFQVGFSERYPSAWVRESSEADAVGKQPPPPAPEPEHSAELQEASAP